MNSYSDSSAFSGPEDQTTSNTPQSKKWLGLYFECCQVYGRAYLSLKTNHYEGKCPRCLRSISFPTGPGGSTQKFFRVG